MDGLNLEQLGTAGLFVIFLLYAWKGERAKVQEKDGVIQGKDGVIQKLNDRNNDNLVTTIRALHAGDEAQVKQLEAIRKARNDI